MARMVYPCVRRVQRMRLERRHSLVRRGVAAVLGAERIPAEEVVRRAADPAGVGRMEVGLAAAGRMEGAAMEPGILQLEAVERERRSNLLAEVEDGHSPAVEADIDLAGEDQAGRRRAVADIEAAGSPGEYQAGVRREEADRMRRMVVL